MTELSIILNTEPSLIDGLMVGQDRLPTYQEAFDAPSYDSLATTLTLLVWQKDVFLTDRWYFADEAGRLVYKFLTGNGALFTKDDSTIAKIKKKGMFAFKSFHLEFNEKKLDIQLTNKSLFSNQYDLIFKKETDIMKLRWKYVLDESTKVCQWLLYDKSQPKNIIASFERNMLFQPRVGKIQVDLTRLPTIASNQIIIQSILLSASYIVYNIEYQYLI